MNWVSVDECLPDDDVIVLGHLPGSCEPVWLVYLQGDEWYDVDGRRRRVTHWCDVPAPPS